MPNYEVRRVTTENLRRDSSSNSHTRRSGSRGPLRLAIITSVLASQVYLFFHFWTYYSEGTSPTLGDYLLPISITFAITLAAVILDVYVHRSSRFNQNAPVDEITGPAIDKSLSKETASGGHRPGILRIVRSCERLSNVEDELILRVSSTTVDRPTGHLMAQMQICTRRIMKQLEELD